jgi:hypothetical protein
VDLVAPVPKELAAAFVHFNHAEVKYEK